MLFAFNFVTCMRERQFEGGIWHSWSCNTIAKLSINFCTYKMSWRNVFAVFASAYIFAMLLPLYKHAQMCFFKNDNSDELLDGITNLVKLTNGEKRINKLDPWLEKMLLPRLLILILMFHASSNCRAIINLLQVNLV